MQVRSKVIEQISNQLTSLLEKGKVDVPVLPETAHKVMMLTQDSDSDAAQLANTIQSDPTMAGHIMRIANSAAYTPNSNLVSIQQAVARLGLLEISNIALSTSLNSKMFDAPNYKQTISEIWQHALATALWSKEVARQMRSNVEAAFLCGLLHSIGKPVIIQTLSDNIEDTSLVISDVELNYIYSKFEEPFSEIVANEWDLPSIVKEAICYCQRFQAAPNESELAATIAFGSELSTLMLYPDTSDTEAYKDSKTLEVINLYPEDVEAIINKESIIKANMESLSL